MYNIPVVQLQVYRLTSSRHAAPFLHGSDAHSRISCSQSRPAQEERFQNFVKTKRPDMRACFSFLWNIFHTDTSRWKVLRYQKHHGPQHGQPFKIHIFATDMFISGSRTFRNTEVCCKTRGVISSNFHQCS